MAVVASLSRRLSAFVRKADKTRCNLKRRRFCASLEALEPRQLLAGLVMSQSVFDSEQFAANIEEQVPVDTTGPNGVVGFSYAIIDGDPGSPISGAGGNRRISWDGPFETPLRAPPNHPQEIASISKAITGSAIMHLLQEQFLQVQPNAGPDELRAALNVELNKFVVDYLPGNWGPGNGSNAPAWAASFDTITLRELLTHSSGLRSDTTSNAPWQTTSTLPGGGFSGGGSIYN